jgi:hypothetical protein
MIWFNFGSSVVFRVKFALIVENNSKVIVDFRPQIRVIGREF